MSALLRSGDIKDYIALGEDGQAVYTVSSQLRDAIRFKLRPNGKRAAEYLAIPQRNDMGNVVDYYVPFSSTRSDGSYSIVPWTSATEEEKATALAELDQFKTDILRLGEEFASKADKTSSDNVLFSRLLFNQDAQDNQKLKAIRFPNQKHVYLVDGRPVITFWGFAEKNRPMSSDPFIDLRPIPSVVPPVSPVSPVSPIPAAETSNETTKKRAWYFRWWFWLPLLTLLLLALWWFLLRNLFPSLNLANLPWPNMNLPSVSLKTPVAKKECVYYRFDKILLDQDGNEVTMPDATCKVIEDSHQKPFALLDGKWVNPLTGVELPEGGLLDNLKSHFGAIDNAAFSDSGESLNDTPLEEGLNSPSELANSLSEDNESRAGMDEPSMAMEDGSDGDAPLEMSDALDEDMTQGKLPAIDLAMDDSQTNPNGAPSLGGAEQASVDDSNTATDMMLTPEQLLTGDISFLNGQWNASSGIQDKATGKPLSLQYQIENGQGSVSIVRGDGVKCSGSVSAKSSDTSVTLMGGGLANCSDNSTYQLPDVICKPGASGAANCTGSYGNQSFPIFMKSELQ